MPTPLELRNDVSEVIDENGFPCTITHYSTITFPSGGYDDEQHISASGTLTSGGCIILPVGPSDRLYVEQGLVNWNDGKIFLTGSIPVSGNSVITVGNTGSMYEVIAGGVFAYNVSGTTIHQTVFVRKFESGQHAGVT